MSAFLQSNYLPWGPKLILVHSVSLSSMACSADNCQSPSSSALSSKYCFLRRSAAIDACDCLVASGSLPAVTMKETRPWSSYSAWPDLSSFIWRSADWRLSLTGLMRFVKRAETPSDSASDCDCILWFLKKLEECVFKINKLNFKNAWVYNHYLRKSDHISKLHCTPFKFPRISQKLRNIP